MCKQKIPLGLHMGYSHRLKTRVRAYKETKAGAYTMEMYASVLDLYV